MIAALAVIAAAGLAAAYRALDRFGRWVERNGNRANDRLAALVFGLPMTLGGTGSLIAAAGLSGHFTPRAIVVFALPGAAAVALVIHRYAVLSWRARQSAGCAGTRSLDFGLLFVIAALAFLTLTVALAPATTNEWDALAYHLAAPKVWMRDGRIHPIPYDHHSNFPMVVEMLFSVGLAVRSVPAAKCVHWLYGMFGALACFWAGREWVSRRAGLLAAALFLAAPIVVWEAGIAYIDLASTAYAALAVFAVLKALEARDGTRTGWVAAAGAMAGFAAATKMTMVATSGLVILWVALAAARRSGLTWRHAALATALALLIGGPWYIKTWVWTGNPVYPFAWDVLGGRWWDAEAARWYAAEQGRFGVGKTPWALWVSPWTTVFHAQYYANPPAVFRGALADARGPEAFPAVYGSLGLAALAFVPLWLLGPAFTRARNRALRAMVLYSGAFWLIWFGLTHQTRYLMVLLPMLLVPSAEGARTVWRAGTGWRWGVGSVAALALLGGLIPAWVMAAPAFGVAWGGVSRSEYLSAREPIYAVSQRINASLPEDARILLLQEVRGFYLDRVYQWGNPEQNTLIPWSGLNTPDEMDVELRRQGITHVLVNWSALDPNAPPPHWAECAKAAIREGLWTPVISSESSPSAGGGIVVYEIAPRA